MTCTAGGRARLFGRRGDLGESAGASHGEIGQYFTVDFDSTRFQAVHQLAIGEPIQTRGRADALNPQTPELPLTIAAVAIRITASAICPPLCGLLKLAFGEEKTLVAAPIHFSARTPFL